MTSTLDTPSPSRSQPVKIAAALLIVYVVWGSTYLAIRIMVEDMPPLLGAGTRAITAGVLVAGVLVHRGGLPRLAIPQRQLLNCALLGLLLLVLGQGLVTVAESGGAPSGVTALLIAAVPLWVVCYRAYAGERPSRMTVAGVLTGFAGIALVTASGTDSAFPFWTLLVVLVAGACWAFGSWCQPRIELPRNPFVILTYEMLFGGVALTITGLSVGEHFDPLAVSLRSWAAWGYLVVIGSIAFAAYIWLLQSTSVSLVATYAYVNPMVAMGLGWLVLAEPITTPTVVGGVIVVLAVAAVVRSESQSKASRA